MQDGEIKLRKKEPNQKYKGNSNQSGNPNGSYQKPQSNQVSHGVH